MVKVEVRVPSVLTVSVWADLKVASASSRTPRAFHAMLRSGVSISLATRTAGECAFYSCKLSSHLIMVPWVKQRRVALTVGYSGSCCGLTDCMAEAYMLTVSFLR
jgi:hypothetical protein